MANPPKLKQTDYKNNMRYLSFSDQTHTFMANRRYSAIDVLFRYFWIIEIFTAQLFKLGIQGPVDPLIHWADLPIPKVSSSDIASEVFDPAGRLLVGQ